MKLRILYFATFRDVTGVREETLSFTEGLHVKDLKSRLGKNHPELIKAFDSAIVAVNRELAFDDHLLKEGDEVAIFPPVSGGSAEDLTIIRVTQEPLDMNALFEEIITPNAGAACVLTGVVQAHLERDEPRETAHRSCEPNAPMTEKQMQQLAREIRERWAEVEGVAIVRRIDDGQPGTPTVMIVCTAAYRNAEVFEAARYGIDRLTEGVPILMKEFDPE